MQVLPYAGLHGERERAATTDDEERPPKQPRTDKHGEHAYPTDRSKPASSARDQSAGTSSSKQNQPVGDLSDLLKATDETTLTTIIELLDAGKAVPKKSHHSQQKAGKDVTMTDADGTDGGGNEKPPPISSADLKPLFLAPFRPSASCDVCGKEFTVDDTVYRQIGVTCTTCCDTCQQNRVAAGDCTLAYKKSGTSCVDAPITVRPHKCHNCEALVAPTAELVPAGACVKVMSLMPFYREEDVHLLTTKCACGENVATSLEQLANKGLWYVSGHLHSALSLHLEVAEAAKIVWCVPILHLAYLHDQRMRTMPAMKEFIAAIIETASLFGWTRSKVPPDARISDLLAAMLAFGQQKYAFQAASLPEHVAPCLLCTKISIEGDDGKVTVTGGGCRAQLLDGGSFGQTKKEWCKEDEHPFATAITDAPQILVPHQMVKDSIDKSATYDPKSVQPVHATAPAVDLHRAEGCSCTTDNLQAGQGQADAGHAAHIEPEGDEPGCSREDRNMRADNKPNARNAGNGNKVTIVSLCAHLFVFGMISYWGNECHAVVDALLIYMLAQGKFQPRAVNSNLWAEMANEPYMVLFYDLACRAGVNFSQRYKYLTGKDLPFHILWAIGSIREALICGH